MKRFNCGASFVPVFTRSGESALIVAAIGNAVFTPAETSALLRTHFSTEVTPAAARKSLIASLRCAVPGTRSGKDAQALAAESQAWAQAPLELRCVRLSRGPRLGPCQIEVARCADPVESAPRTVCSGAT